MGKRNQYRKLLQYIIWHIQFSTKNYQKCIETGKSDPSKGKKKKMMKKIAFEEAHMLDLAKKKFKAVIINMFKDTND